MRLDPPRIGTQSEIFESVASEIRALADGRTLRILEAGCGRRWPIDLGGVRYALVGVDLDEAALASRQARFKDLDESIIADLREVQFPAASFDVIYSAFVLEHVQGAEALLAKFLDWLKPGGLLVLQFPDRDSVYGFVTRVTPHGFHIFYKKHFRGMTNAGQPGFGPYPTYHDRIIARKNFHAFVESAGLRLKREFGFGTLPYVQQKFVELVSVLSFGKLASRHIDLCYILQRPCEQTREAAVETSQVAHG